MADVASKQQTKGLFLSTTVTRTRRHTELTKKKMKNLKGNLRCAREYSVQIFVQVFFLHSQTAHFNLGCMEPFKPRGHWERPLALVIVRN